MPSYLKIEANASTITSDAIQPAILLQNMEAKDDVVGAAPAKTKTEITEYISGSRLWAVAISVTLVMFILMLDISILSTAIPSIMSDFHRLGDVGWYIGAYQLASCSLQPLTGKIYSSFSSKWTYLAFVGVSEIGSLICGLASSSGMLIGGRVLAGLGASGLASGGMTVIAGAVPLHKRPLYTGVMFGIGQIGTLLGPVIGGLFTQYATWRWCFYMNLPIGGVVVLLLVLIHIPDLTVKPPLTVALFRRIIPELDLVGFVLFAPASVMFLLALEFGGSEWAWNSPVIIGLFCGAGVAAIVFGVWEWRMGDDAMLPFTIIRQRIVWTSSAQTMFLFATVTCTATYLPMYFQAVKGATPSMSGVYLLPSIIMQMVFIVGSGALLSKWGYYLPWVLFSGVITAISNGLMSTFALGTATAIWVGYQILAGAGRGAGMQMGLVAIQNFVAPAEIPVSIAFLFFSQNLSSAVTIVIATTIFSQSLVSEIATRAPSVSPADALSAGGSASAVRALLPTGSPELPGLLCAYAKSIDRIFYLLVGMAVASLVFGMGMGWKDTRRKTKPDASEV